MEQVQVRRSRFAALAALVAAVAIGGWAAAQTTIDYFSFTTSSAHIDALEELIDVFEAENPDVRIRYTTADFGSYFTKLQTDFAAGNAPDVFELNYENFVTFASRGTLLDLGAQHGQAFVVGPLHLTAGHVDALARVLAILLGDRAERALAQRQRRLLPQVRQSRVNSGDARRTPACNAPGVR